MSWKSIARDDVKSFKTLGLLGEIFRLSMKMQKDGESFLPLHLGDPARFDFPPLPSFKDGIIKALDNPLSYAYGNPQGYMPLVEKIADIEGVEPRYVFTGNGVSDMMDKFFNATAIKGTNVLLPAPVFAPYFDLNTKNNIESRLYRCDPQTWQPIFNSLESQIDDSTSIILINSPNNPTGAVYQESVIKAIIQLADEIGKKRCSQNIPPLCLIFDEIYSEHYFDEKPADIRPLIADKEFSWVIFNGASKAFNATGLRMGYAVVGGAEKEAMREVLYNECILPLCMNLPYQAGYLAALSDPAKFDYFAGNRAKLKKRRDLMLKAFAKIPGISAVKPQGAFYMIIKMDTEFRTDLDLGLSLLSEVKICTSQLSAFFDDKTHPGGTMLRLVILPPEDVLEDAMTRIASFMERHGKDGSNSKDA